jgi:threonine dehydrogenase-like Zn-dependent dehydrogenase
MMRSSGMTDTDTSSTQTSQRLRHQRRQTPEGNVGTIGRWGFVITHRLSLEDAPHGYEMFRKKEDQCIKVVLKA